MPHVIAQDQLTKVEFQKNYRIAKTNGRKTHSSFLMINKKLEVNSHERKIENDSDPVQTSWVHWHFMVAFTANFKI